MRSALAVEFCVENRVEVSSRIREDLLQRAGEFNIVLEDVSITHLTFGKVCRISLLAL